MTTRGLPREETVSNPALRGAMKKRKMGKEIAPALVPISTLASASRITSCFMDGTARVEESLLGGAVMYSHAHRILSCQDLEFQLSLDSSKLIVSRLCWSKGRKYDGIWLGL